MHSKHNVRLTAAEALSLLSLSKSRLPVEAGGAVGNPMNVPALEDPEAVPEVEEPLLPLADEAAGEAALPSSRRAAPPNALNFGAASSSMGVDWEGEGSEVAEAPPLLPPPPPVTENLAGSGTGMSKEGSRLKA